MKEITEIIAAFGKAQREGLQCALVTLVHVDGSSYRRPGARMLVTEKGELTGAISGGCLEGDALNKASLAIHQQKNLLVTYDTTDEDDAVLGLGLGCNGVIQVLIQPVQPSGEPINLLRKITESRKRNVLVTLFSLHDKRAEQKGTCIHYSDDRTEYFTDVPAEIKELISEDLSQSLSEGRSLFRNYKYNETEVTAYIEYIPPVVSLVIAGAGNDADPVAAIATVLGWQVTLIDDGRDKNTKSGRFAGACQVKAPNPLTALEKVVSDEHTYFILMTHNYNYDLAMLRQLLKMGATYIGVLGPRKKMDRMIAELEDEGFHLSEKQAAAIHNPVGLDIGAESPEEIALSIIAEIKAVISGKAGHSLKNNDDVIHPRHTTQIETRNHLA
jgi:xanthine/CO dehydrogenase XdhC/CoxF family maturation factor